VTWWYFDVDVRYFEEILFDLNKQTKRWEELIKHIECTDVLVQCQ